MRRIGDLFTIFTLNKCMHRAFFSIVSGKGEHFSTRIRRDGNVFLLAQREHTHTKSPISIWEALIAY